MQIIGEPKARNTTQPNLGRIVSVRGSVVDALFPEKLPAINNELRTGEDEAMTLVTTH